MIAKNKKQGQKAEDVIYHASITSTKKLDYNSAISTLTSAGTPYETAVTIVRDAFDAAPETSSEAENKIPLSTQIVRSCLEGCSYHTDPDKYGEGFVKWPSGEVIAVMSNDLSHTIGAKWFIDTELTISATVMAEVINHVRMKCATQGTEFTTFKRVGRDSDGCIQIATHNRKVGYPIIQFDRKGSWELISPVGLTTTAYPTNHALKALPIPTKNGGTGGLTLLWKHIKLANRSDERILLAWILTSMMQSGVYPILELIGDAGSTKTMVATRIQSLIDPSSGGEVDKKKATTENIAVMTDCHHVIRMDNVGHFDKEFSDFLCKCSTGSTDTGRKLYSNGDIVQRKLLCCLIITGVNSPIIESDLMDRTISLTLQQPTIYKSENECEADWKRDYPTIHNMLVTLLALVIPEVENMGIECRWRMVDFVKVGEALNKLLGYGDEVVPEKGDFLKMMIELNHARSITNSDGSPAISALIQYAIKKNSTTVFDGFIEELLEVLRSKTSHVTGLPAHGRGMGSVLKRNKVALEGMGFTIEKSEKQYSGKNKVIIKITNEALKALRNGSSHIEKDEDSESSAKVAMAIARSKQKNEVLDYIRPARKNHNPLYN